VRRLTVGGGQVADLEEPRRSGGAKLAQCEDKAEQGGRLVDAVVLVLLGARRAQCKTCKGGRRTF
jgi:hypothetical protein